MRFAFQRRHLEDRIRRNEPLAKRLARSTSENDQKGASLFQGRIRMDVQRLTALQEELDAALSELAARRTPTHAVRLLHITRVLPTSGESAYRAPELNA